MTSPRAAERASTRGPNHRWMVLAFVAIAQLMVVLDATIVNIALPDAQRALGFANNNRQWIVTAYALAFGSLLLLGGRLSDMFGRKFTFIGGAAGFAIASAVGGASTSFGMLVTARAAQGVFGAVLAPAALSTLVATFRDPKDRGKAFGIFGSVAAGGSAVGLVLGGVLTEYLSWRWSLYVNLFFAALAIYGAVRYFDNERPAVRPKLDVVGTLLASSGLFGIVFGFSHASTAGWTSSVTLASLVAGVLLLTGFVVAESRVAHPLLPLRIVTDRTRGGAYTAVGVAGTAIFGVFLFLTYFLQLVKGFSPVMSGLAFLPMTACILISANVSTVVTLPKFGPRVHITSGMVLGGVGMLILQRLTVSSGYAVDILPALMLMGLGFGMVFAPAINTATAGVARADSGVASAMVNTMQQVGGSVGTALLSTVAASATTGYAATHHVAGRLGVNIAATHGYTVAFDVAAGLFALGAVLAATMLPSRAALERIRETNDITAGSAAPVTNHDKVGAEAVSSGV
jgi:EmrB/QacA subfamily drug resistance transporter